MPYRDPDSTTPTWVLIFVLASLLVHLLLVIAIILMSIYMPPAKIDLVTPVSPEVTMTLKPAPAPTAPPPPKTVFMPTQPQQNAKPKNTPIESDNNSNLTSQSKQSRQDSVMPDVQTKNTHADSLTQSPNSPSREKPQPATPTPPTPQQQQQKPQPTPPQPKAQQPQPKQAQPTPNPSTAPKPPPTPSPTPPPKPVQYDPNGLPELPAINAPTIAPQTPQTVTQMSQTAVPPPLLPQEAANVQGRAGLSGSPSPEAMATELGRYKAMVYRAVGSRWYQKVGNQLQVLGVGSVHIQFTIYSDGTVRTKVLDGGNAPMQLLLSISLNSIIEAAPFPPFSPALQKEIGGDSYTDDFTFSIYSGN
jgi:outer membrane biosynthesis protein TonB